MKMNLTGAIEILKLHKHTTDKFKHSVGNQYVSDAIDTVVSHFENPTYTKDRIIEILVTTKALTEHLSQDERNEFFEKAIKYWEATE